MSQIRVNDLTFHYEGSYDNIFEHTSFSIDTGWKLGFVGRNGRGKTTFLKLLTGALDDGGARSAAHTLRRAQHRSQPRDPRRWLLGNESGRAAL